MSPKAVFALVLVLAAGCATEIGAPRPTIELPASRATLDLAFGPEVPALVACESCDSYHGAFIEQANQGLLPDHPRPNQLRWRELLGVGFEQGFSRFFKPPTDAAGPDETLSIEEATPEYTRNYRSAGIYSIHFRVRLVDRDGRVVRRSFGTAQGLPGDPSRAVEVMYEMIARDLFAGDNSASSPSASSPST